MKKRFSSLTLADLAAWSMAIGTFAFLAGAGVMTSRLRKRELPHPSRPNLTPGI
jgi:hypothetical protein